MTFQTPPAIRLRSGKYFNFVDFSNNEFTIEDVAHGLSNLCRFNGQSNGFYSVAQHSIIVSYLVPDFLALEGLLHDAPEFAYGDITTPFKTLLGNHLKEITNPIDQFIYEKLGVPNCYTPLVKAADLLALATERRDIMPPNDPIEWECIKDVQPLALIIKPASAHESKHQFLSRYYELKTKRDLKHANS